MGLEEQINDWKKYPNALGSEAQVAVIIGEVATALNMEVPQNVTTALRVLSLRGTMRDIASAIQQGRERGLGVPSFHEVVDIGALAAGLSWTEAIVVITGFLDSAVAQLHNNAH
jgi:hypothetical protein